MSVYDEISAFTKIKYGQKVVRAAATLPQTTAEALFTVVGGKCAVTMIEGEVTTVMQTQANNTKLTANPTTGTSSDICAVLNTSADEVGTLYGISGTFSDALFGVNAGALQGQLRDVIVNIGTIDLDCAASNTGAVKWTLYYVPLEDGAYIEAA